MTIDFDKANLSHEELTKLVKEVGGQRAFERNYGIKRTTLQGWLKKGHESSFKHRPLDEAKERNVVSGISRFILTSAQDSTSIDEGFLDQLETYRDWLSKSGSCEIMVAGYTYNKSLFEDHTKRHASWPSRIHKYMVWDRIRLDDKVDFCAEMNTRPTAETPLAGFETYTGQRWGIFPHPKVHLKSIPTMRGEPPKMNMTTGSISKPNYVPLRAGIKAQFHHVIGAVLVEIDEDGTFFCRHLMAEEDGSFYDLDRHIKGGTVTENNRAKAINWGDLHVAQIDPQVCAQSFGLYPTEDTNEDGDRIWKPYYGVSMLDHMMPEYQFFNDVSDFRARNHHNQKDPHHQYALHVTGKDSVERELYEVAGFIENTQREWCETVVVNSNHDQALCRWLREADYKSDPLNARFFLQCQTRIYEALERKDWGFSIFEDLMRDHYAGITCKNVRFLKPDESFKVLGIQKGLHGHEGANGSRGSVAVYVKTGMTMTCSHVHSPEIRNPVWAVGTKSKLFMGYNGGLSSWAHTDCITYQNGNRVLVTHSNGKWHL